MVTPEDLDKLAELARIKLSPEEKKKIGEDFSAILNYISELQSAPTEDMQIEQRTEYFVPKNSFREDGVSHQRGEFTESIIKNAPRTQDNLLVVKKIL